ncbi:MAG: RrF2 family transcriptional regulator [Acidobacteriota bacterium]
MSIVSRKSRYALHGLAFIAVSSQGKPVPYNKILEYLRAYSQNLSLSTGYIAKVFQELSRAGFTAAVSGPHGGYQLARPAGRISLIDVVEALDGPLLTGCCLLSVGDCPKQSTCGVRTIIQEAELAFYRFFQRETVATLARRMDFPVPTGPPRPRKPPVRPRRR